uniref:Fungal_trans domain-containing protein n=1 Tax=Rhabditophanes sp. KR3021 TaxID=114890 RepID=A0AC35UAA9_9BILA
MDLPSTSKIINDADLARENAMLASLGPTFGESVERYKLTEVNVRNIVQYLLKGETGENETNFLNVSSRRITRALKREIDKRNGTHRTRHARNNSRGLFDVKFSSDDEDEDCVFDWISEGCNLTQPNIFDDDGPCFNTRSHNNTHHSPSGNHLGTTHYFGSNLEDQLYKSFLETRYDSQSEDTDFENDPDFLDQMARDLNDEPEEHVNIEITNRELEEFYGHYETPLTFPELIMVDPGNMASDEDSRSNSRKPLALENQTQHVTCHEPVVIGHKEKELPKESDIEFYDFSDSARLLSSSPKMSQQEKDLFVKQTEILTQLALQMMLTYTYDIDDCKRLNECQSILNDLYTIQTSAPPHSLMHQVRNISNAIVMCHAMITTENRPYNFDLSDPKVKMGSYARPVSVVPALLMSVSEAILYPFILPSQQMYPSKDNFTVFNEEDHRMLSFALFRLSHLGHATKYNRGKFYYLNTFYFRDKTEKQLRAKIATKPVRIEHLAVDFAMKKKKLVVFKKEERKFYENFTGRTIYPIHWPDIAQPYWMKELKIRIVNGYLSEDFPMLGAIINQPCLPPLVQNDGKQHNEPTISSEPTGVSVVQVESTIGKPTDMGTTTPMIQEPRKLQSIPKIIAVPQNKSNCIAVKKSPPKKQASVLRQQLFGGFTMVPSKKPIQKVVDIELIDITKPEFSKKRAIDFSSQDTQPLKVQKLDRPQSSGTSKQTDSTPPPHHHQSTDSNNIFENSLMKEFFDLSNSYHPQTSDLGTHKSQRAPTTFGHLTTEQHIPTTSAFGLVSDSKHIQVPVPTHIQVPAPTQIQVPAPTHIPPPTDPIPTTAPTPSPSIKCQEPVFLMFDPVTKTCTTIDPSQFTLLKSVEDVQKVRPGGCDQDLGPSEAVVDRDKYISEMLSMKNKRTRNTRLFGEKKVAEVDFKSTAQLPRALPQPVEDVNPCGGGELFNFTKYEHSQVKKQLLQKKHEALKTGTWDNTKDAFTKEQIVQAFETIKDYARIRENMNNEKRKKQYVSTKKTGMEMNLIGKEEVKKSSASGDKYKGFTKIEKRIRRQFDGKCAMYDPIIMHQTKGTIAKIITMDIEQRFSLHQAMLEKMAFLANKYRHDQKSFIIKLRECWGKNFEFMVILVSLLCEDYNLPDDIRSSPTRLSQQLALEIMEKIFIYCNHGQSKISAKNAFKVIEKEINEDGKFSEEATEKILEIFKKEKPLHRYLKRHTASYLCPDDFSDEEECIVSEDYGNTSADDYAFIDATRSSNVSPLKWNNSAPLGLRYMKGRFDLEGRGDPCHCTIREL